MNPELARRYNDRIRDEAARRFGVPSSDLADLSSFENFVYEAENEDGVPFVLRIEAGPLADAVVDRVARARVAAIDAGGSLRLKRGYVAQRDGLARTGPFSNGEPLVPWADVDAVSHRREGASTRVHVRSDGWRVLDGERDSSMVVIDLLRRRAGDG